MFAAGESFGSVLACVLKRVTHEAEYVKKVEQSAQRSIQKRSRYRGRYLVAHFAHFVPIGWEAVAPSGSEHPWGKMVRATKSGGSSLKTTPIPTLRAILGHFEPFLALFVHFVPFGWGCGSKGPDTLKLG